MEMIIAAAILMDIIIGDPRWLPHPVVFFGRIIRSGETLIRSWTNTDRGLKNRRDYFNPLSSFRELHLLLGINLAGLQNKRVVRVGTQHLFYEPGPSGQQSIQARISSAGSSKKRRFTRGERCPVHDGRQGYRPS